MKQQVHISQILLAGIPFSLCFSERLNTFLVILYAISVLLQPALWSRIKIALRRVWLYPFLFLYLLHLLSLGWSDDLGRGVFLLEKKAALLALPFLMATDARLTTESIHRTLAALALACFAALWFCILYACWKYLSVQRPEVFFYHGLGWPLDRFNALYFSFYLLTAMIFLDYLAQGRRFFLFGRPIVRWLFTLSFCLGILLLSSRFFIALALVYLFFQLARGFRARFGPGRSRLNWALGVVLLAGGLLALGFTRDRFQELLHSNFEVLRQEQFQWDTPFNGLTLRLLFLKFGWEILDSPEALIGGVGAGDAQSEMNAAIRQSNLYHGNPVLEDKGYLDYSFHNQFMEFWVQTGLGGLTLWLILLVQGGRALLKNWSGAMVFVILLIAGFSCIESLMERQRGVVFVAFFLSIFHLKSHQAGNNDLQPKGSPIDSG